MKNLTGLTYRARKAELQGHLASAQDALSHAAYKAEVGEGTADDVAKAREGVAAIVDRLDGLEIAWQKEQERRSGAAASTDAENRKAAAAEAEKLVKARRQKAEKLIKSIERVGADWADYQANGNALLDTLRPFRSVAELRADTIFPANFFAEPWLLGGHLAAAGLTVDNAEAAQVSIRDSRTFLDWVDLRSDVIRRAIDGILPEDAE